jgi:hypothetical protein
MAKHLVASMRIHPGRIHLEGIEVPMKLPKGCEGILLVFESKKAAREYWGKDVHLVRIERNKKEG